MSDDVAYLRFPHLHDDLLCFAAEDDLWVAPLVPAGHRPGRAWRVTVDRTRVGHPRFSPDGRQIAYTTWRSLDPEIHLAPVDGGPARRLGYWGSTDTRVCGWTPPGENGESQILAVSSHGQPFSYYSWAYSVPTDGSPGSQLPWGPVADLAVADIDGEHRTLLLTGKPPHEPAAWKRYRGGATGRLWLHGERLLPDIGGHLDCPMFVDGRVAFLSDHEGVGNLYSVLPDGTDLRRHTDHDAFYARHASSDGRRVVYQCAGDIWLVDALTPDSVPRKLDVRLGGPRAGRRAYQVPAASHVDAVSVDTTGRASAVSVRGSLYWLTHRDGPARTIADTPGVRVRQPDMLGGGGQVAYVTDADGEDAIEIAYLPRATGDRPPRRLASGHLGRVHELVSSPTGDRIAVASHDGRLLLIDTTEDTTPEASTPTPGPGPATAPGPGPATAPGPGPATAPGPGTPTPEAGTPTPEAGTPTPGPGPAAAPPGAGADAGPTAPAPPTAGSTPTAGAGTTPPGPEAGSAAAPPGAGTTAPGQTSGPREPGTPPPGASASPPGTDAPPPGEHATPPEAGASPPGAAADAGPTTPAPPAAGSTPTAGPAAGGPPPGAAPGPETGPTPPGPAGATPAGAEHTAGGGPTCGAARGTGGGTASGPASEAASGAVHGALSVPPPGERASGRPTGGAPTGGTGDNARAADGPEAGATPSGPEGAPFAAPGATSPGPAADVPTAGDPARAAAPSAGAAGPPPGGSATHSPPGGPTAGDRASETASGGAADAAAPGSPASRAAGGSAADPPRTGSTRWKPPGEGNGIVTEVIRSINGPVADLAFSPDGDWLTWSHPGVGRTLRQIKMARIGGSADRTIIDVTNGRFEDENPVFTSDGRYLAFLSWRGFDPVYDVHTGDLSFPLGCRPYLVPLSSATPSPFALSPDGRPAAGGLDPAMSDADAGEGTVTVEEEGLAARVTPFPVAASKYSALHPVSGGGLVWLRWPISGALGETFANPADTSGRPTLEHFDLTKARKSELVAHLDWFAPSGDGTRLVVVDDDELRAVPATEPGDSDSTVYLDLRRILHEVDPEAEWRQAYEEAGRLIRAYFWEPDMCGIDWDGVLAQYRPLVERVASPDEFADLLREVVGELGTSHAYVTPARRNEGPRHYQRAMGLLGANLVCRDGNWMVKRILPGDSSDSKARSPLAGTGIREGAVLTHVDGRPVDPAAGPFPLLSAAGGTTVELTFRTAGPEAHSRRVAIVPLIDERPLRYQDWVAKRREVVREISGGRCGYLHIPDMGGSGWAQFNRDLRLEVSRPALIVDVRGNAGGHISELVVEKLTRRILGWDLTRDAQPVSYASNAPRGPVVAIADEATASDGDMITAAFRLLNLGPVVGQRTWGGVVGITGRHRLGDGTVITVPMNAAWFDAYGWSVENHGVDPDIEALRTPLDWAEGRHAQLDDAVWVALDLLAAHPAATPPGYGAVPDLRRPKLPPRGPA